ncbi:MAG: IS200/IS605 family transposase [Xenococcaceae cyanobacterium MO_207.B15]|nr:IS200/IS605 family transposase [Xenococcaceae cyanobacterium MO_207.B15]
MLTEKIIIFMKTKYNKAYRAVYNLTAHLVLVTKYRKPILTDELLTELEAIFASILNTRGGKLDEFNGETDHIHCIVSYKPSISVSNLVANLKATSSKTMWRNHPEYLKKQYWGKRVLWSGSYLISSCGGVTIEQLRKYVEQQDRPRDQ